jgi:hypothetical protein
MFVIVFKFTLFLTDNQMKAKLIPILLFAVALFSCDEENPRLEAQIAGKYEFAYEDDQTWGGGVKDFVSTIELRADGTYYREEVTKELDSEEVLGYRGYSNGTYTIAETTVELISGESYTMDVEDLNYVPKEDLAKVEPEESSHSFTILGDFSGLEYVCPSNAFCGSLPVYTRLD